MEKRILILILSILFLLSLINLNFALIIDTVSMTPNEIAPGESAIINIEIENNGKEDIEDISVSLNLEGIPFAPYNSATDYNIEEIKNDDQEYARFEIIALNTAKSGIYKIPVEITYIQNDMQIIKNSLISIIVNSEPIISVIIEDNLLLKNKEGELLIRVTNKGLSDTKFLEIEIADSIYYKILSSRTSYIGDIDSNDFDSAKFKIYFKQNIPDQINFPVTIHYKDGINNDYVKNFYIPLDIYSKEKAIELGLIKKSMTGLYFMVLITLIILYIIYKKVKNKKRMRKIKESN